METQSIVILLILAISSCDNKGEPVKDRVFFKTEDGWFYRWRAQCQPIPVSAIFQGLNGFHVEFEKTLDLMSREMSTKELPECRVWLAHAKRMVGSPEPFKGLSFKML